jgi:hypothetical protein
VLPDFHNLCDRRSLRSLNVRLRLTLALAEIVKLGVHRP